MTTLADRVRSEFSLSLSADYAERCLQATPNLTSSELYQKALKENLRDICGASVLPYGVAAQVAATLPNAVVLQINNSRDATQPLRPCADITDEEAILNAAMQRNSDKRLLRLLLTDGNVEIPALELSTLRAFRGIPVPGEKLLVHKDAEVRNGCIILTEDNITLLGGEVQQLKQDFLAHRRRLEAGYQTSNGLDGAPRFEPLQVGQHYRGIQGPGGLPNAAERQGGAPPQWSTNAVRGRGGGFNNNYSYRGSGGGRGGGHGRGNGGERGRGGGGGYRGGGGRGHGGDDGRGRGRGGGGYRGRGSSESYHFDVTSGPPPEEKFPAINEVNFPRLS
ncbi:hypothetical protein ABB37_02229 [Leptomonas pyrrhocoris]|uniref:RecQ-mediated genome instability protein 1 n=1 Tax=Leptomonas pyrrhocoris TaxID=157538 RepID=A0A0N0VGQ9_LEPPY|nr:hypothetical protein ABB37_02229 [Leptomonas pyrrhocoris]XP_015662593.1 hypothetical protein ABB37_02229 [Leptomonas pyrrhocoris]KPA84153.1 hypothetical protein ABB37_02229 [Leptomonas pyrrhocoris]KPA84154.1 hypothetical protein ABB37_02229 [Leptomonas pyrrhocoris]|eukprot:XP_015662592.1 hypothetical protein ABB37_02229 [Leptomonas pyrrhocoris]